MGPLSGHHHETYVISLPGPVPGDGRTRWKVRETRPGVLWFDRRCLASEEELLKALAGRVRGIPEVIDVGGVELQRFVEGRTLGSLHRQGRPIPESLRRQIMATFADLLRVTPWTVRVERRCEAHDRPQDGDSAGFLERLVAFSQDRVYRGNLRAFEELFWSLGVDEDSFRHLRKHVSGMAERPFCLLHADLHRENLVVDRQERLWAIDWELAAFGDPLYDLATHLYLTRYPADQERRTTQEWCSLVEDVRPGASRSWEKDLLRILDFKRAQSVFTDIIRLGLSMGEDASRSPLILARSARRVHELLTAAAAPLGLAEIPSVRVIASAYLRWSRFHRDDRRLAA
ncbi:phosphotransferase [Streptomyces coeruleorubidus]|uniref:phosphotransferase n=1 Tax=Streptomyces coeruleorubidus TaxID=116188 RepID=UPI00367A21A3